MTDLRIRTIEPRDDADVARIIRTVMPEFGACGPGFAICDPEVDTMCTAYRAPRSRYYVVLGGDRVVGGGGYAPLQAGDADTAELRKMYFLPEVRGTGTGRRLLGMLLRDMVTDGFSRCYLETLRDMHAARRLYEAAGFQRIDRPMGSTGHYGCDAWYVRDLSTGVAS